MTRPRRDYGPHPMGWPNALHPRESPCRIDQTRGRQQHRCSASHANVVVTYRDWRDSEYEIAEIADQGTAHSPREEPGTYWETHAKPTFKRFLLEWTESYAG